MKQFGLAKPHKLCSVTEIDRLFQCGRKGSSALAYPLRAVWLAPQHERREGDPAVKMLISVPKKRLRHAVDRVTMRRRIREAYRLNHGEFEAASHGHPPLNVAFIYVADKLRPSKSVEGAMRRLLASIYNTPSSSLTPSVPEENPT